MVAVMALQCYVVAYLLAMDFLFVGWQRIFSVKFWPVSSFLMAFLFLSTKVLVHPVVKVNISKINI